MGNDVLEPLFCLFTAGIFLPVLGDRLMLVILVVMNPRNHRAVLTLGFLHFQLETPGSVPKVCKWHWERGLTVKTMVVDEFLGLMVLEDISNFNDALKRLQG